MKNIPVYTLKRSSRRRTVEIQVRPEGVRVLAPERIAKTRIDQFVAEKSGWITQRQSELKRRLSDLQPYMDRTLQEGTLLQWLGDSCLLRILPRGNRTMIEKSGNEIRVQLSSRIRKPEPQALNEQLERWYKDQADLLIQSRVRYWTAQTGFNPTAVKTRSYRRKWGCCNSRREISFNWLLIMAPLSVIDYVIVHELCHLKEMNHSSHFWRLVDHYYPEFRKAKQWLNQNGSAMRIA